ncbi:Shedu anti-phage system protein SduA domain-containing protein [Amycolatopsis taiwanensis]|uniref:Shedu protein SduA C-terminal domain-containing protein n=1 Tax=Amycolatopsis taiwanensis TaxID=342230 RepID=A0A9W6R8L2_9PSEU|nr:Shedu anti-phage system protein SduA domain-containing protein [Amycolatopsis taiwanensis]GLY71253.1 hypothetical protein Atai01_78720 [Amycolatopsis taiwanensis]
MDWALERQIEQTDKQAQSEDVKTAIAAVLRHIRSGRHGNRRGGRELVQCLEIARLRASEENEWHVVRLLQDALDYCEGRALKPEFEERFLLFQDGKRNENNLSYIRRFFELMLRYTEERGREILVNQPNITPNDFLGELVSLTADGQFAEAPDDRPGRYRIVRGRAEMALWLERIFRNRIDIEDSVEAARSVVVSPDALAILADEDRAQMVLRAAELKRHAAGLDEVRRVAEDSIASESDLHRVLRENIWIFGGRYLGAAAERRLTAGNELDIPLIRADGALHVVELKRSMRARALVKRHRNAWVPTAEVHDAVGQAINYLVSLDEDRREIREKFGIETRRASALVLVGHPKLHPDIPEEEINDALRTLNSHTSRVEVLTYKDLIDSAERTLKGKI